MVCRWSGLVWATLSSAYNPPSRTGGLVRAELFDRLAVQLGDPPRGSVRIGRDGHPLLQSVGAGDVGLVPILLLEGDLGSALPSCGQQQRGRTARADHDRSRCLDGFQLVARPDTEQHDHPGREPDRSGGQHAVAHRPVWNRIGHRSTVPQQTRDASPNATVDSPRFAAKPEQGQVPPGLGVAVPDVFGSRHLEPQLAESDARQRGTFNAAITGAVVDLVRQLLCEVTGQTGWPVGRH